MLEKIARLIDGLLGLVAGLVAAALLLYGGWALYDGYNTNRNALSDPELARYRPTEDADADLVALRAVNPDVVGWITLDDTDIDYPVLQGADDMTYVNRDVYGRFSLSGSIYLAAACAGDFSDPYSLIYGHHMENGAMFGGLDRFADPAYLQGHTSGRIRTADDGYGHAYTYTVREGPVKGYFPRYKDYDVYNTKLPAGTEKEDYDGFVDLLESRLGAMTEQELEDLMSLFGYKAPHTGLLPTGDDLPLWPIAFAAAGLLALAAAVVLGRKRRV